MEEHVRNYSSSGEIETDFRNNVEQHGTVYTDPLSLFGMCLEQYAHFLVSLNLCFINILFNLFISMHIHH